MRYICETCAVTRSTVERQVPWMNVTWWTAHTPEEPTLLSQYLAQEARIGDHSHSWIAVRGGGNGVQCALGQGRQTQLNSMEKEVIDFLRFVKAQETPATFEHWLAFILNHRTAGAAQSLLWRLSRYPTLEQAWWSERLRMEEGRVAAIAEAKRYWP
jgi:hypothetical protein